MLLHRKLTGTLVIATHNPGKLPKCASAGPFGIEALSRRRTRARGAEETGRTFAGCAHQGDGRRDRDRPPAFADDSGLVVEALGGEPGIHSARWAGESKDFRAAMNRIQTLLIERGAREPAQRRTRFAALCLAWPDGHVERFEGRVDGVAVWPPRGEAGFGYDPLFLPDGFDHTFGQMSADKSTACRQKEKDCRIAPARSSNWRMRVCRSLEPVPDRYNFKDLSAANPNSR